jgi:1-deoxy-D-xylulose-5-phosphate synthase
LDIHTPRDIKKLKTKDLELFCEDIREFLIETLSKTGGHLASNLGVVELTVAWHKVFNSPHDKIIWDVGHQSYVHKIITGRSRQFTKLRCKEGLSGFPKSAESPSDAFNTGHASTSISAALGFCLARDLQKQNYHVTAVIGDGSMTGGLAYEAINNAGRANTNLLVVLNDNQMSISENVGALSRYLNEFRTAPAYIGAKADVNLVLSKIPLLGRYLRHFIERTKEGIKYLLVPGGMFEELGFTYIGPVDGHNLKDLISVLGKVKQMSGPVLLHVYTVKGKGYCMAEEAPSDYHGVDSFNIDTGVPIHAKKANTYSDIFGSAMLTMAQRYPRLVAVCAAMTDGVGLKNFEKQYPDRMFDVGIAEGHAVTFSAGMAKAGMIPVVAIYSTFLQRSYDQILHDVCMQNLHVIFAIDRAGIVGADGETHQGLFDISFLALPNMTVMAPSNKQEFLKMLDFAMIHNGPIAIRYPKCVAVDSKPHTLPIVYGKPEYIHEGEEIVLVAVGPMTDIAIKIFKLLKPKKNPGLINARFIYPINDDLVYYLKRYKYVFVLEEHVSTGGFGSLLFTEMARKNIKPELCYDFSLPDAFIEQGSRDEILESYGLCVKNIYDKIIGFTLWN